MRRRTPRALAACLAAAQVNRLPEDADWRTPWEREATDAEIVAYETRHDRPEAPRTCARSG